MEDWIYRIMNARDPDWRILSRGPLAAGIRGNRPNSENTRREK